MLACVVVVPCYNEQKRLNTAAFRAFAAEYPKIAFVFVNDGSTDGTREVLDELNREDSDSFMVLHLERNEGKAEAVRRGMQEAFRLNPIYAGYWDADLATPLEAIPDFTRYLDSHPGVEMLFGARVRLMGRRIVRRPLRHYLGRVFATMASVTLGIGIYDTQCGAKIFRMSPRIDKLFERPFSSRWIFDVEILARFLNQFRTADQESADDVIHEIALSRWEDVAGSKVRPLDFFRAIYELWMIHRIQLRKNVPRSSVAVERVVSSVVATGEDAPLVAPSQQSSTPLQP